MLVISGIFDDEEVTHVEGEVDPIRDLDIITDELRLKDVEYVNAALHKMGKNAQARINDKVAKFEYETLTKIKELLSDENKHVRTGTWNEKEVR